MKTYTWPLLGVVVCGLMGTVWCASVQCPLHPVSPRANDDQLLSFSHAKPLPTPCHVADVFSEEDEQMNFLPRRRLSTGWLRALDPQPDDDYQADGDSADSYEASLALSDRSIRPAEWQLTHSDPLDANSFINSKAIPPP